ncbi:hypothetical protein BH10PSE6_BH10PSE6_16170 [soil metagenome]
MGRTDAVAYDPSVADYRATSPFEWGGIQDVFMRRFFCWGTTGGRWNTC